MQCPQGWGRALWEGLSNGCRELGPLPGSNLTTCQGWRLHNTPIYVAVDTLSIFTQTLQV